MAVTLSFSLPTNVILVEGLSLRYGESSRGWRLGLCTMPTVATHGASRLIVIVDRCLGPTSYSKLLNRHSVFNILLDPSCYKNCRRHCLHCRASSSGGTARKMAFNYLQRSVAIYVLFVATLVSSSPLISVSLPPLPIPSSVPSAGINCNSPWVKPIVSVIDSLPSNQGVGFCSSLIGKYTTSSSKLTLFLVFYRQTPIKAR